MLTSILKALPGKLDIKRHVPSILYFYVIGADIVFLVEDIFEISVFSCFLCLTICRLMDYSIKFVRMIHCIYSGITGYNSPKILCFFQ